MMYRERQSGRSSDRRLAGRSGFAVMEMLVYLVISVAVIGSIYQVLIGQNRLYSKEREVMDVRGTLRAAAELLSVELRMASPGDGDIYSIQSDSIVVRSLIGSGVVCAMGLAGNRGVALYATSGTFGAEISLLK